MVLAQKVIASLKDISGGTQEQLRQKLNEFMPEICKSYQYFPYEYAAANFDFLRDIAMANLIKLYLNSTRLNFDNFHKLEPLFTETGPVAEARLFALMLISISEKDKDYGWEAVAKLLELQLVESGTVGKLSLEELRNWPLKLLDHCKGKQVLTEIYDLTKPAKREVDLENLAIKVQFFTSPDVTLWGYSGINIIYINLFVLQKLHEFAKQDHDPKKEILIWEDDGSYEEQIKMVVAIIGFHELTHIIIRKSVNNANDVYVGKRLDKKFRHFHATNAGVIAQIRFFDLPPIRWERLAVDSQCVHELFKFVSTPTLLCPKFSNFELGRLLTSPSIQVSEGLYKLPPSLPGHCVHELTMGLPYL